MTTNKLFEILLSDKPSILIKENEEEIFKMIPELKASKGFKQNNIWHIYDVYEHILHVIDETDKDLSLRVCALFHDTGKPYTYQEDENGVGHFPFHWVESLKIFERFVLKYDLKGRLNVDEIKNLIYFHDINIHKLEGARKEEFYKIFNNEDMIKKLFNIKKADLKSQNPDFHHYLDDYNKDEELMLKSI
ncbi:MAG: HD domain-containing protein [Bacilli bacterium]|nr:HD domain-containing protein [Bacilli bacterium]